VILVAAGAGCGGSAQHSRAIDSSQTRRTVGVGRGYQPPAAARPNVCSADRGPRYGVHLELFARRHVVLIPAGIGISPPLRKHGPYVSAGSCYAAAITLEPTGVIDVTSGVRLAAPTLSEFFAIWGQPLGPTRLASFAHQRVVAYVDGVRSRRAVSSIRLTRHAEIVLEVGGYVAPHRAYRFAPGL